MITALAGGRLLAEKFGAEPISVIALHGWGRSGADFAPILAGLNALAIHFPGFGITPPPESVWGAEEYADDLARALAEGPARGPFYFVGHSFGGRVAVRLASRHPELVRGIVLTGVPLLRLTPTPKPALSYRAVRWLVRRKLLPASVLEAQRRRRGSADYLAAHGVMRDILVKVVGEDYRDDLAKISAPVRMVWGEHDDAAPVDAGRAASTLIPNAQFRVVADAGHLLDDKLSSAVREELHELIGGIA